MIDIAHLRCIIKRIGWLSLSLIDLLNFVLIQIYPSYTLSLRYNCFNIILRSLINRNYSLDYFLLRFISFLGYYCWVSYILILEINFSFDLNIVWRYNLRLGIYIRSAKNNFCLVFLRFLKLFNQLQVLFFVHFYVSRHY